MHTPSFLPTRLVSLMFLCLFSHLTAVTWAQTPHPLAQRIMRQIQLYPQEKTYVHTDATDYRAGDRVWLKVYVVEALNHQPTNVSRYAYVELIAPDGTLADRIKLQERDGAYAGYLDIPDGASPGRYLLRSYTLLSASVQGYESTQNLYVAARADKKHTPLPDYPAHTSLPSPLSSPMHFSREGRDIIVSTTMQRDSLYLVAHCRAFPFAIQPISPAHPVCLSADTLPQGVISLLLTDRYGNILAERLLLSANDGERVRLPVRAARKRYGPGDEAKVLIDHSLLHPGERADLSVSVRAPHARPKHPAANILAQLFLATDVSGLLPDAALFYSQPALADSLLATQQWSRYPMAHVFRSHLLPAPLMAEQGQTLRGKVRTLIRHRPVADAEVSLIIPSAGLMARTTTDSLGEFRFTGMDLPAHTDYLVKAGRADGTERVELTLSEANYPALPTTEQLRQAGGDRQAVTITDSTDEASLDGIMLEKVEVVRDKLSSVSQSDPYARNTEFSFGTKEIEDINASCMHELLRRVPGIYIHDEKCYVRSTTSIQVHRPAAIVVDGIFMDEEYDLDDIIMSDVSRVDVYKGGTTVLWGARGGSGVISVTTKRGNEGTRSAEHPNQKKATPLGYQQPVEFARLSGAGKTVWWQPVISKPHVTFTAPSPAGRCHVTIEGVTSEGRLVHEECEVDIE